MSPFSWLLIGHLVGDWLLQNSWMAQGKKKALFTWAGFAHFTIYTFFVMLTVFVSDTIGHSILFYGLVAGLVFVSHWLIDATDGIDRWMRFYGHDNVVMVRIMVDQTFHILVLAGITLLL